MFNYPPDEKKKKRSKENALEKVLIRRLLSERKKRKSAAKKFKMYYDFLKNAKEGEFYKITFMDYSIIGGYTYGLIKVRAIVKFEYFMSEDNDRRNYPYVYNRMVMTDKDFCAERVKLNAISDIKKVQIRDFSSIKKIHIVALYEELLNKLEVVNV